jgi:hypothetical protein
MRRPRKRKPTEIETLTREELVARLRLLSRRKQSDGWFGLGYAGVKWVAIAFCAWQARLAIADLAGKETVATIGLRLDVAISYAVAAGAG